MIRAAFLFVAHFAVLALLLVPPPAGFSQSWTEEEVPTPLNTSLPADLFPGEGDRLLVVGIADSVTNISFDDTYGIQMPYCLRRSEGPVWSSMILPDTGEYHYGPFLAEGFRFSYDAAVRGDDTVCFIWSRQGYYATDVPPVVEYEPRMRCVLATSTDYEILFNQPSAKNPRSAAGSDGSIHWVWESVSPILPDTDYHNYRSSVEYRSRAATGELSAAVNIGTGFSPQIMTDLRGRVHIIWLQAAQVASEFFRLQYRIGRDGDFSPPVLLRDSIRTFGGYSFPTPPVVSFSVDDSFHVYAAWSEPRGSDSRYFLVTLNGPVIQIDSSQTENSPLPDFAFHRNGAVHAVWGIDTLSYSDNIDGPLFSKVRVLHSAVDAGRPLVGVTEGDTPKGIYTNWRRGSLYYIRDLREGPDSTFEGPSGQIPSGYPSVSHPMLIDQQDRTWLVYGRGQSTDYSLWLTSFSDGPLSVDETDVLPERFVLHQNYPNPFNPATTFSFSVPRTSFVDLTIYDLLGREVAALVRETRSPGHYEMTWDARDLPSGVYFYRLRGGDFVETRKLILLR